MRKKPVNARNVATKDTTDTSKSKLKVTVHIPEHVPRRQEKINRIYDILKPVNINVNNTSKAV